VCGASTTGAGGRAVMGWFATDERGNIYLVGYEGMVYQLDFTGTRFDKAKEPKT